MVCARIRVKNETLLITPLWKYKSDLFHRCKLIYTKDDVYVRTMPGEIPVDTWKKYQQYNWNNRHVTRWNRAKFSGVSEKII